MNDDDNGTPLGGEPDGPSSKTLRAERFIWKPGDVTIMKKGQPSTVKDPQKHGIETRSVEIGVDDAGMPFAALRGLLVPADIARELGPAPEGAPAATTLLQRDAETGLWEVLMTRISYDDGREEFMKTQGLAMDPFAIAHHLIGLEEDQGRAGQQLSVEVVMNETQAEAERIDAENL